MSALNRSARAHRSTKVPNVVLRPAPANASTGASGSGSSKSARASRARADDAEADAHFRALRQTATETEAQMDEESNWNEKPLAGAVVSFSGLGDKKNHYQQMARELGAEARSDMPENTHFLLAVEPLSVKCTKAVDAGIRVVRPRWLEEVRRRWCHDDTIDIDGLAIEHALDPFENLNVVLAGFHDADERKDIRTKLAGGGAMSPKDTDLKQGGHTHVLCSSTAKAESITLKSIFKLRARAERYERRNAEVPANAPDAAQLRNAKAIRCIVLEWMQDSLEVGACLDSDRYDVDKFSLSPGERRAAIDAVLRNRARVAQDFETCHTRALANSIAQDVSPEGEERVSVANVTQPAKNTTLLRNIVAQVKSDEAGNMEQQELRPPLGGSREHAFQEHQEQSGPSRASLTQPAQQTQTKVSLPHEESSKKSSLPMQRTSASSSVKGVFAGLHFTADLLDASFRNRVVEQILRCGGTVLSDDQSHRAQYCVVECRSSLEHPTPSSPNAVQVTIWWVEQCIYLNDLAPVESMPFARPSIAHISPDLLRDLRVSITQAAKSIDDSQCVRVLQSLGVATSSGFSRGKYSHLYCGSDEGGPEVSRNGKIKAAQEWGVPVVGPAFVHKLYSEGSLQTPGAPLLYSLGEQASQVLSDSLATTAQRANSESSNKDLQTTQLLAAKETGPQRGSVETKSASSMAAPTASSHLPVTATQMAWESVDQSMVGQLAANELAGLLNATRGATTEKVKRPTSADLLSRGKSRKMPPSRSGSRRATSIGSGTGRDDSTSPDKRGKEGPTDLISVSPSKTSNEEHAAEPMEFAAEHKAGPVEEDSITATRISWDDPNAKRGMLQLQQMMAASIPNKLQSPGSPSGEEDALPDKIVPSNLTGKRSAAPIGVAKSPSNPGAKRARMSPTAAKAAMAGAKSLSPTKKAPEDDAAASTPHRQILARKQPNSRI